VCTLGGIAQGDRRLVLLACGPELRPVPWAAPGAAADHTGQAVGDDGQRLRCGVNDAGLALALAWAAGASPGVLACVLARAGSVAAAAEELAAQMAGRPQAPAGVAVIAGPEGLAVADYGPDRARLERCAQGCVARACGSAAGTGDAAAGGERRQDAMLGFLDELYVWMPLLDDEDTIERCQQALERGALAQDSARGRAIVDAASRCLYVAAAPGRWRAMPLRRC